MNIVSRLVSETVLCGSRRSFAHSACLLVVALLVAGLLNPSAFVIDAPLINDGHALRSLEQAQARVYCGRPSYISDTIGVPWEIRDHPELRTVPLRALAEKAGSIQAYCDSLNRAVTNNENSLMLLETGLLRVYSGFTARGLGRVLHLIRIAGIAVFAWLLIDLGGSLALAVGTLFCALLVLGTLQDRVYSLYPFLFVVLLTGVAYYGFALKYRWTNRRMGPVVCGLAAGVLASFTVNMRSSYLPIATIFFIAFLLADFVRGASATGKTTRGVRAALVTMCFVSAYVLFQWGLITRFLPSEGSEYATHIASHSIVIAVAVPENDLSRRMGITWEDGSAARKALEVDPQASYLGPRYDAALNRYYQSLWSRFPREMVGVYIGKFSTAGKHMFTVLQESSATAPMVRVLIWPLSWLPNGIWLLGVCGVAGAGAFALSLRSGSVAWFVFALLSLAACLLQVESGIVYSLYTPMYQNYVLFYVMFLTLAGLQAAVCGAGRMFTRRPA